MDFKKLGLCLSGGGGKGAYQIGAWEALIDFGLADQIREISGTSVGGLNGAMVAQNKLEQAKHMWLNISSRNMLSVQDIQSLATSLGAMVAKGAITPLLANFIQTKGLFKPDGLKAMISEGLDKTLMASTGRPLTVAIHNTALNRVDYGKVNDPRTAADMLMATAALPMIFDEVQIDGNAYCDGGFHWGLPYKNLDNTPIKPLIEAGCDTIIVVCMSPEDLSIRPGNYPGVRVIPIIPTQNLGGMMATLDFSNEGAKRRMVQGHNDATQILRHLDLFLENEVKYKELWRDVSFSVQQEKANNEKFLRIQEQHLKTVTDIVDFDRQIASDYFSQPIQLVDDENSNLLEDLRLANTNLLNDIERREIETNVQHFIDRNTNNKQAIETAALDALAALAPVEGRATYLSDQGVLSRLWGAITGSNQKISAENDKNLAQAQFAALRLIAAVQEKGAITLEFSCAMNNRINGQQKEIERLGERHNRDLRRVYKSMASAYIKIRNKIIEQNLRLDAVEQKLCVHDWVIHPNKLRLNGKPLKDLPPVLRLCCLVHDFFRLTKGRWSPMEMDSLHEMCINVNIDGTIRMGDFYTQISQLSTRRVLTQDLVVLPETSAPRHSAARWLQDIRSHHEDMDASMAMAHWGYSADMEFPVWDFLAELLYHFRAAGFSVIHSSDISGYKQHWLEQIKELEKLIHEDILPQKFGTELQALRDGIQNFRLKVPLIGKFSVGKSTLLNEWLKRSIQSVDLGACTSLATEFYYTEPGHEKLVSCWLDDPETGHIRREEEHLSVYPACLSRWQQRGQEPLCIEIHLSSEALAQHPDLVLVDTPGLGSTQGQHEKAIQNYIGEAVTCVLCVTRTSQVGVEELAFIDRQRSLGQEFSLLVCQEDLSNPSERQKLRESLARQAGLETDRHVPGCSAREGDFSGFQDVLAHIETRKDALFRNHFSAALDQTLKQADQLIRDRLAADTNASQLEDKKRQLHQAQARLEENFRRESDTLQRDCRGPVMRQVMATVSSYLRGRRSAYAQMLLNGQGLGPLLSADARNACQLAIEQHLTPRLRKACAQLESQIELGSLDGPALDDVHGPEGMDDSSSWGSAAAGAAAGAAIGGVVGIVVGGLMGFFGSRSSKESEAEGKANQAIESVITQLEGGKLSEAVNKHAQEFLSKIKKILLGKIDMHRQNIEKIEQQLMADAARKQEIERRTQQALTQIARLMQEPAPIHSTI